MNKQLRRHNLAVASGPDESVPLRSLNGSDRTNQAARSGTQRVTITLSVTLLERLRNAIYWTGQGTMARLIDDALDDAVTQLEQANGGTFPVRLAPLKRGRPRLPPLHHPHERAL